MKKKLESICPIIDWWSQHTHFTCWHFDQFSPCWHFDQFWPCLTYFYQPIFISANLQKRMWDLSTYSHLMVLETKIVKHFPDKEEVGSLDVTCYKHLTSLCSLINRVQKCVLNLWKPLCLAAFVAVVFYFHKVTNKEEEKKVALWGWGVVS